MNNIFLSKTILFSGCSAQEIDSMLGCLSPEQRSYRRGSVIYRAGDIVSSLGLVISGSVYIESDDIWGNKSIIDKVSAGQVFAETYACANKIPLMINVTAAENCEVLFLDINKVLNVCSSACGFHTKLIFNLLQIMARKNLGFHQKIEITSKRTTREKLMAYLLAQAKVQQSDSFEIPFDRQALADYLEVDRSGLSAEISKLRKEGVLECYRSRFTLL